MLTECSGVRVELVGSEPASIEDHAPNEGRDREQECLVVIAGGREFGGYANLNVVKTHRLQRAGHRRPMLKSMPVRR